MKKTDTPEQITLTLEESEALKERIRTSNSLSEADVKIVTGLITFNLWLQKQLSLAQLSISRLKKLFGISTEKKRPQEKEPITDPNQMDPPTDHSEDQSNAAESKKAKKPAQRDPQKNHGRNGVDAYTGCPIIHIDHPEHNAGDACPDCQAVELNGKLSQITPGVLIRLQGNPLITGHRYEIEKLRCNLCGQQYSAPIPEAVKTSEKYAPSCKTTLAIGRYYMGLPFKRIETWQSFQGIPLPDATSWDKTEELYHVVQPVHQTLEVVASEGKLLHCDDSPNRILEQKKLYNLGQTNRKGVYTTAIISQVGAYDIYLFRTSEHYAGENMDALLSQRESNDPFFTMSDASQNNFPKKASETLLARWIICFCLVHGRRKFFEICDFFDTECDFVLEQISAVYQNEAYCLKNKLSPEQRLAYHQRHSAPIMQSLWVWLNNQLLFDEVESNSGLGQAIRYMLRHWHALTRFLYCAGAPIDNSWCERAIKIAIRHRRNSLFFKTTHGAQVGDCLMSLIMTAVNNGVNPFDYLNTLQVYPEHVAAEPQLWLPWHYQDTLAQINRSLNHAA